MRGGALLYPFLESLALSPPAALQTGKRRAAAAGLREKRFQTARKSVLSKAGGPPPSFRFAPLSPLLSFVFFPSLSRQGFFQHPRRCSSEFAASSVFARLRTGAMKPGLWSWVALGMLLDFLALHSAWRWRPSPSGNPLAFLWAVAVGRCVSLALAGGTLARSGEAKLPWKLLLQGALVLAFQMPGYVSLKYLYQPEGGALELAYCWGRSDILALNYLVLGLVMLLLFPWGPRGTEQRTSASFGRLIACLRPEALWFVAMMVLMVISCMGKWTFGGGRCDPYPHHHNRQRVLTMPYVDSPRITALHLANI